MKNYIQKLQNGKMSEPSWGGQLHNFTEEKAEVVWGAPSPDNFWKANLTPTNYISLEREFDGEWDSF